MEGIPGACHVHRILYLHLYSAAMINNITLVSGVGVQGGGDGGVYKIASRVFCFRVGIKLYAPSKIRTTMMPRYVVYRYK